VSFKLVVGVLFALKLLFSYVVTSICILFGYNFNKHTYLLTLLSYCGCWTANTASKGRQYLREFIRDLLVAGDNGDKAAAKTIRWENRDDGIFCIMDPEQLAQQWGIRKQNKEMTYDKLSRALRSVTN